MELLFNLSSGDVISNFSKKTPVVNSVGELLIPLKKQEIITDNLQLFLNSRNINSYSGTGANWLDLSPNSFVSSLINTPSYSANNGGLINFNGIDQSATIINDFELDYSAPFTIQTVVNLSSGFSIYPHIFSFRGSSARMNLFYSESEAYKGLNFGDVTSMVRRTNELINYDAFNLITLSFLGGDFTNHSNYSIEVNSVNKPTTTTGQILVSGSKNRIGNTGTPRSGYWWKGSVPVVLVYGKLLNTVEKNNNYNLLSKVYNF